jgi:hypothetical protein
VPVKDQATLLSEFPDNTTGEVSPADSRDIIDTLFARTPMGTSPWDVPVRVMQSGASTTLVHGTDYLLEVNKTTGSPTTVTLPNPTLNWRFEVKDGKGDAVANPITVTPSAGTIDDQPSYVINEPYASAVFTGDGSQWRVT